MQFFKKFLFPFLLIGFAFFYYGAYYRCGLYPSGEGGVEGVTALRLLAGKRPIVDVALNYNLFWFYPLVALFKVFGPSYTLLRIFFFSLATITGLLTFYLVKTTTRHVWLGVLAGFLALILPGQLFRNYMAFAVVLNMMVFLKATVLPCHHLKTRFFWIMMAGFSLGLAFLIRIDLGFFLNIILLALILFTPWMNEQYRVAQKKKATSPAPLACFSKHIGMTLLALLLVITGVLALHLPVYNDAKQRGFASEFLAQYQQWPHMIITQGSTLIRHATTVLCQQPAVDASHSVQSKSQQPSLQQAATSPSTKKNNLLRSSLVAPELRERITALNLYLPILCALLLACMAFGLMVSKISSPSFNEGVALLTCLACSFTLFPQYFFWRPDMVHLSEFMVPMTLTLLIGLAFAKDAWKKSGTLLRIFIILFSLFALLDLLLYFINGCQSQSTGGIAISQQRTIEFSGANGVHVQLAPHEFEEASAIYQSIITHSQPGEYVICYPYNPEINFMTDRPSYRRNLYCDDMTAPKNFDQLTISEIENYHPAVIVVTDWPINGTEHSRFSNWASTTYQYIQTHYRADYEKGIIHVFVRK